MTSINQWDQMQTHHRLGCVLVIFHPSLFRRSVDQRSCEVSASRQAPVQRDLETHVNRQGAG